MSKNKIIYRQKTPDFDIINNLNENINIKRKLLSNNKLIRPKPKKLKKN